ncbi:hypothetical protein VQ042_21010 [Aurantimonas sp. A2-1-M11]|uniref:hypothetical protein n=1 Tax=Aurantimonas sp. A2-1-M11 TaxID=3113712 RepID=UPI002F95AE47
MGEADALREALDCVSGSDWSITVRDGEYEPLPAADLLEGRIPVEINIMVTKPPAGRTVVFLQPEAALRHWDDDRIGEAGSILVLGEFRPFVAGGRRVSGWDGIATHAQPEAAAVETETGTDVVSDVRRGIVRDLSGGRMPGDLNRWLPSAPLSGDAFSVPFMRVAASKLMLAFGSEVEVAGADSDEAGHAFQDEAGHLFRFHSGRRSDLKPATS